MTIAACYVSSEGVVLGADSTTSTAAPEGIHFLNHAQKLFEVGENSTLGIVVWGLGGLITESHRTLVARLSDHFEKNPPKSVEDAANVWCGQFWQSYTNSQFKPSLDKCQDLAKKKAFDPKAADPGARTQAEEAEFIKLKNGLFVGFIIGGYVAADRVPAAFELTFDPLAAQKPKPVPILINGFQFRGAPSMTHRLIYGCDEALIHRVLTSKKWTGTEKEFVDLVMEGRLTHPVLPIRDAIDFIHTGIYCTIKAMKFSDLSQVCGGPIEIAVVTTDRKFRWVRHKAWDAAINEGSL